MTLPTTTLAYVAILGLIFAALVMVAAFRRRKVTTSGQPEDRLLDRIRVKGNFGPHVFLLLVIMAILELGQAAGWIVHLVGVALVAGRLLYASGVFAMSEALQRRLPGLFAKACIFIVVAFFAVYFLSLLVGAIRALFAS